MKLRRSVDKRGLKTACTVSAAALMLGVSQAATVGLHFQLNYCADPRYSGFPVTMTAFGIASNGWQNLTPMDTGYSCGSGKGPYTLNQLIDTTTATGGLHPLPNGSLHVTWSADTANFSGFAGYGGSPPGYDYGGTPPIPIPTGEWQIYSTFLRDSVNFGPNNLLQGYSVEITGLKSLFTNTPYVVELIAASDSMQTLTNAFVIDLTASSTQSVVYPSTPFPGTDWGGTGGWFRGHGGGLSTASASLNTDHLNIMGNHAQNGVGSGYPGFDRASTISGFIITDKPVVTMSPQPVLACGGDSFTLNPYAIGVPPLSYQWRMNGAPISGATKSTFQVASVRVGDTGNYDLIVTNLYGSATSAVSAVTVDHLTVISGRHYVLDSNPVNPENDGLALGKAAWAASSGSRNGVMSFGASTTDQITVPPGKTLNEATNGTILFWMRSSGLINPSGSPATLFDRRLGTSGVAISQATDGSCQATLGNNLLLGSGFSVSDNNWHLIAVTYDQTATGVTELYVDGNLQSSAPQVWSWAATQQIELALSHDTNYQRYSGLLDDVRVYNRILTDAEVASVFSSGALVDTSALVLRLNFDAAPANGVTLRWLCPDAVLQSADAVTGPYTDLPSALSGFNSVAGSTRKFFRYHGHAASPILSNPYMM